ncbi:IS30 family transposase [Candidatus Wolfebacteria bacterium]|nr:IS30 family transposase [Candidatus Wolfebacteria bacterium]
MRKYTQLSYEERVEIDTLRRRGVSIRQTATHLGRSPNTVSRELKAKKRKGRYTPKDAQRVTYEKRYHAKRNCMKVALDPWLTKVVFEKLEERWSPERIAGWCTQEGHPVSTRSVYRFVHGRCLERYLFRKRYRRKSGRKVKKHKVAVDGRRFVESRGETATSGHFEADFIVSSKSVYALLVVVDRYTRYTRIKRLPNRKHQTVSLGFQELFDGVVLKTLTLDNDISFAHWRVFEQELKTRIYFTHPYRSWEKGLVENTNRWIRLFVPKRTDIASVTDETIRAALRWLNQLPRQCLGFKTATDMVESLEK